MYYLINTTQKKVLEHGTSYERLNEKRTDLYINGATDNLVITKAVLGI